MSNNGNPNPTPVNSVNRRFWLALLVGGALVIAALFIGAQMISVLYGIVFPPLPPRPQQVTEISHTPEAHGVDKWLYATTNDACQLTRFYQNNGGECKIAPDICTAGFVNLKEITPGENVSQCTGTVSFSIFKMRWETVIASGYQGEEPTQFNLSREVFWSGEVPPVNFSQLVDEVEQAEAAP